MTSGFDDQDALWRRCETAWASWLSAHGRAVMLLSHAEGNAPRTQAPLMYADGFAVRAPDLQATVDGRTEFWEVKYRTRPDIEDETGEAEFWIDSAAFRNYRKVAQSSGSSVMVAVCVGVEHESAWWTADIHDLFAEGRSDRRYGNGGELVDAWVWPRRVMQRVSNGPQVDSSGIDIPLLPVEGHGEPLRAEDFVPFERRRRKQATVGSRIEPVQVEPLEAVLIADPRLGLDLLRREAGIPSVPNYSVTRLGLSCLDRQQIEALFGLLHYGIRLFIVSNDDDIPHGLSQEEFDAFRDSRQLELSVHQQFEVIDCWIVDGQVPTEKREDARSILKSAEAVGGLNADQYWIVHASPDEDIIVTAGAGTGKTETMSERMVFLLAMSALDPGAFDEDHAFGLRIEDFVLVTFTREAAAEIRARISRTLNLRRRLSRCCIFPTAWLLQLGRARISTIHGYAQDIVRQGGASIGLAPGFTVSNQVMELRAEIRNALSGPLEQVLKDFGTEAPAAHYWERHLERVWAALENNGVRLLPLEGEELPALVWGPESAVPLERAVQKVTREVIERVRNSFGRASVYGQRLSSGQLVPAALAVLSSPRFPQVTRPRYVFVDEFQDTDPLQLELVLELRRRLDSRLFVVGDPKQGIYRFRGATGNAFDSLDTRVRQQGLRALVEYGLTLNFRSGGKLLNSISPYFETWGDHEPKLLPYARADALRPDPRNRQPSSAVDRKKIKVDSAMSAATTLVEAWKAEHPASRIAVLVRTNAEAREATDSLRSVGIPCSPRVGGDFFRSDAVLEMRVLLEAIANPTDRAAILELAETRWGAAMLPEGLKIMSWPDRLSSLSRADSLEMRDLDSIASHLEQLRGRLRSVPTLAWIVDCVENLRPADRILGDLDSDEDRNRYDRGLEHLVMLLDDVFSDSPASLDRVLDWLRIQIGTNDREDEPFEEPDGDQSRPRGEVLPITVHKSKGQEFDFVVMPRTDNSFTPNSVGTHATVLDEDGRARVLWRWRVTKEQSFSNESAIEDLALLRESELEELREQTRLLYVAMTRAKSQLVIFENGWASRDGSPQRWSDLLRLADSGSLR